MKVTAKLAGGVGAVLITMAAAGTVAFADTSGSSSSGSSTGAATPSGTTATSGTKIPAALKAELQADRAAVKASQAQNKQLSEQIKADIQGWKSANPNPFKQLTADQQTTVKNLRVDIENTRADMLTALGKADTLRAQLITARQNKDTTTVASLKAQIEPLATQAKSDHEKIQADMTQLEALLPKSVLKTFHANQSAFKNSAGSDWKAVKPLGQKLRADLQTLKADRQSKAWEKVDSDLKQVNSDLTQIIAAKEQLIKAFPASK